MKPHVFDFMLFFCSFITFYNIFPQVENTILMFGVIFVYPCNKWCGVLYQDLHYTTLQEYLV